MSDWPSPAFLMPVGYDSFGHPAESSDEIDELSEEELLFEFVGRSPTPAKPSLYPDYVAPVDSQHRNSPGLLTSPLFNSPMQIGSDYHDRTITAKQGYTQSDIEAIFVKAIMSDQKVKIWYNAESDNFAEKVRNVSPLNIRVTKKGKYIVTSINGFREIRTYRIDRTTRIKELFIPAFKDPTYSNYYSWLGPTQSPKVEESDEVADQEVVQLQEPQPPEPVVLTDDPNPSDPPFTAYRKKIHFREMSAEDNDEEPGLQLLSFQDAIDSIFKDVFEFSEAYDSDGDAFSDLKDGIEQLEGLLIPFSYESFEVEKSSNINSTLDFIKKVLGDLTESNEMSSLKESLQNHLEKIQIDLPELKGIVTNG